MCLDAVQQREEDENGSGRGASCMLPERPLERRACWFGVRARAPPPGSNRKAMHLLGLPVYPITSAQWMVMVWPCSKIVIVY